MAIKPPSFQRDAIPSRKGWHHPQSNELLLARTHTDEQIADYLGLVAPEEDDNQLELFDESDEVLENMSKLELEQLAREYGVELDRRHTKQVLIDRVREILNTN